ncbi:MAG: RNA polymerase subunit sigma [Clostridiales bacterium]|nr:RNA polymerase subunit sigma [Clostridiales bacterium]
MREIDERAIRASKSEDELNRFLMDYETYILKHISKITGRFITKSDDEWAIGFSAFSEAITSYSFEKGSFLHFSEIVLKRRLSDFFRKQSKYQLEFPVSPYVFSGEVNGEEEDLSLATEIASKTKEEPNDSLKNEILAISKQFEPYGFSFYDLISCSPKSQKTKDVCFRAIKYLISEPILLNEMRKLKILPLKIIVSNTNIPRKILERHRKYIIAAAEIITGDYPCLSEYMRSFREE